MDSHVEPTSANDAVSARAEEIFTGRYDANLRRVDRMMAGLMAGQWVAAIVVAVLISPYAWAGRARVIHEHVLIALGFGAVLTLFPAALAWTRPGWVVTRNVVAVAQMLWSALLIHLTGGRIETHFHVFGSLAFLAFYRDWKVLIPATVVVALDHMVRQTLWPESVFGVANPESWRFLEHAFWVVFEDVFLVMSCIAGVREMRSNAAQQARIEVAEQVAKEMEIATRIQTAILPRAPEVAGLEISARMLPAAEVGGDYYDVLAVPGGCWIGIGDVAGHGLVAGLVMLQAQSAVKALVLQGPDRAPREVLADLNRVIHGNVRERLGHAEHMTLSLVRYREDGRLTVAGAHQELVVCRAATGRCERVEARGTWLGLVEDIAPFTEETELRLETGDVLVLYTDGITEAMNDGEEQYGLDRLCTAVEGVHGKAVGEIRDHLLAEVGRWSSRQADDLTVLVLRHRGTAQAAAA